MSGERSLNKLKLPSAPEDGLLAGYPKSPSSNSSTVDGHTLPSDSPMRQVVSPLLRVASPLLRVQTISPRSQFCKNDEMTLKYLISEQVLGSGSSTIVKSAFRRDALGQMVPASKVAVKVLKKGSIDEESCQMLQEEYDILKGISHPNIVKVCDIFTTHNHRCAYLFMELLGPSLTNQIQEQGAFSEIEMRRLFRQLTSALAYMHDRRIVHRDVKPDNVLIESDLSRACLIDFNFARRLSKGGTLTTRYGDRNCAAPEMLLDISTGECSDIWGLGICLYVGLSGGLVPMFKRFIRDDELGEYLITATTEQRCKWVESTGIPKESPANDILYACLSPKPSNRPPAFLLLSHPWLTQVTEPEEEPASPARRCPQTPQRRKRSKDYSSVPANAMAQCVQRLCRPEAEPVRPAALREPRHACGTPQLVRSWSASARSYSKDSTS
jgi:serine/threonine protein kinase